MVTGEADQSYEYDVFISYSPADKAWVRGELLVRLEKAGLKACIDYRDFRAGAPAVKEIERAAMTSRKTLLVLTPNYLTSGWTEFERYLLQTQDPTNDELRLLPVLKKACELPSSIGYLSYVNFTDPEELDIAWMQVFRAFGIVEAEEVEAEEVEAAQEETPKQWALEGFGKSGRDRRSLEQIRQNLLLGKEDARQIEKRIGKRPSTRRTFLKMLGVGLGGAVVWRVLWNLGVHKAVTVDKEGIVRERQPVSVDSFKEDLGHGVALEMVRIPGSKKFKIGSPEGEKDRAENEGPQLKMIVSEFMMGRFEVTQEQYEKLMNDENTTNGNTSSAQKRIIILDWLSRSINRFSSFVLLLSGDEVLPTTNSNFKNKNKRPVVNVSWNDAKAFCKKLSDKTGRNYRLPSEAEWEYACRAGTTTPFHVGDTLTTEFANYDGNYTYADEEKGWHRNKTTDVGIFPPNVFGLYDMHGNVWEWCADRWRASYDDTAIDDSDENKLYVQRGGSYGGPPAYCRSAVRRNSPFDSQDDAVGFRVACDVSTELF